MAEEIDLSQCDKEPIHLLGFVQPFAALLKYAHDGALRRYSSNAPDFLSISEKELLAARPEDLFTEVNWNQIKKATHSIAREADCERLFRVSDIVPGHLVDVNVSLSRDGIVVELELSEGGFKTDMVLEIRHVTANLDPRDGHMALAQEAADYIGFLTGFDRVIVYRFHPDKSGEVIAESVKEGVESYLGLRYPASDIPSQARALYEKSLIRIIPDVEAEPARLKTVGDVAGDKPLDMSLCISRAVSPVHIQYLKNMRVRASMSISIVTSEGLWGLIACHNIQEPLLLPPPRRSAAELFAHIFSFKIAESEAMALREVSDRAQLAHAKITTLFSDTHLTNARFIEAAKMIQSVVACDGVVAKIGGEIFSFGETPDAESLNLIVDWLENKSVMQVFATDCLSDHFEKARDLTEVASGIMAIPISKVPEDYLVLLRGEQKKTDRWAGNPVKAVAKIQGNIRLQPRESFAEWRQEVSGKSAQWSSRERTLADALKATFVEVLYKLAEQRAKEQDRANQRQELLISELNHRVRNILALVSGLVDQTSSQDDDVDKFKTALNGRVKALTEAHNLMTAQAQEGSGLFKELLETELRPYMGPDDAGKRWQFNGPNVALTPASMPIMALVIHEMTTNAVKYGALSNAVGKLIISTSLSDDGSFNINWLERGGPPVARSNSVGTGTRLIEEAIPYQLQGTADLRITPTGLQAAITLPASAYSSVLTSGEQAPAPQETHTGSTTGHFLLVEDEYIIASTVKAMLNRLGAREVSVAPNSKRAHELIEKHRFDFAILDVNLRDETSEAIAEALQDKCVPFIFATGYGQAANLSTRFDLVARVQKPFAISDLVELLPAGLLQT